MHYVSKPYTNTTQCHDTYNKLRVKNLHNQNMSGKLDGYSPMEIIISTNPGSKQSARGEWGIVLANAFGFESFF